MVNSQKVSNWRFYFPHWSFKRSTNTLRTNNNWWRTLPLALESEITEYLKIVRESQQTVIKHVSRVHIHWPAASLTVWEENDQKDLNRSMTSYRLTKVWGSPVRSPIVANPFIGLSHSRPRGLIATEYWQLYNLSYHRMLWWCRSNRVFSRNWTLKCCNQKQQLNARITSLGSTPVLRIRNPPHMNTNGMSWTLSSSFWRDCLNYLLNWLTRRRLNRIERRLTMADVNVWNCFFKSIESKSERWLMIRNICKFINEPKVLLYLWRAFKVELLFRRNIFDDKFVSYQEMSHQHNNRRWMP